MYGAVQSFLSEKKSDPKTPFYLDDLWLTESEVHLSVNHLVLEILLDIFCGDM